MSSQGAGEGDDTRLLQEQLAQMTINAPNRPGYPPQSYNLNKYSAADLDNDNQNDNTISQFQQMATNENMMSGVQFASTSQGP